MWGVKTLLLQKLVSMDGENILTKKTADRLGLGILEWSRINLEPLRVGDGTVVYSTTTSQITQHWCTLSLTLRATEALSCT